MFMVIPVPKIYPACHTDDNRNKQGSNLTVADKRVAQLSKAEYWDIKILYVMFELLVQECFKNIKSFW